MKKQVVLLFILIVLFLSACTPKVVVMKIMAPVKQEGAYTVADLYAAQKPGERAPAWRPVPNMSNMIVIEDQNLAIAVTMYELKELFWAQFNIYNSNDDNYVIDPSDFLLLDGNRTAFHKAAPDEAANLFLSKVSGIPPFVYQPKYIYSANSTTSGYLTNSGHLYANTQTTGTIEEDQMNKAGQELGYALGAGIIASQNKKLQNMAAAVFQTGLVENSEIPAKTGAKGGIYWLKPKTYVSPLILRVQSSGKEYAFRKIVQK
ncbi:MAG: hypothetical protein IMZ57_06080 [Acidobacteria bacterium]|nr:hypothetical protein [Acidobacteriota bacterium]